MLKRESEKSTFLQFELFQEESAIRHGCFLRDTGIDSARIEQALSSHDPITVVSGKQVHGDRVVVVEKPFQDSPECDALITNVPDLALTIRHADCQAALFYDPIHRAIGAAHSGWRGSVQNIFAKTVQAMQKEFATKPENLLVAISPSLGPDASQFINYQSELPEAFHPFQFKPLYFDFWQISRRQLEEAGLLPHHIQLAEICTFANPEHFFSYRFDKTAGRNATAISLKKSL